MIIINAITNPVSNSMLNIGRQGEHNAKRIWFDLTWLIENYGDGTAVLVHQRSKDIAPYICNAEQEANRLVWSIDGNDTAYDGIGKAEIRWTVGNTLAKTVIYKTNVLQSITADEVIPDPYESWYDKMMDKISDNEEYAEQAEQSAQEASQSAQDASNSADRAEQAVEDIESASVILSASSQGSGIVTINASLNRG